MTFQNTPAAAAATVQAALNGFMPARLMCEYIHTYGHHKTSTHELRRVLREFGKGNGLAGDGDYATLFSDDGVCQINVAALYMALLKTSDVALRVAFSAIPNELIPLTDLKRAVCKEAIRRGLF